MTDNEFGVRLERLENRFLYQEAALEELTRTLLKQEQRLREQAKTIRQLETRLLTLTPSPTASPDEETPPPHY